MNKKMNLHGKNGNGQAMTINIDPEDLTFVECECGCQNFQQGVKVGKLSSVHPKNSSGQDLMVSVPVTICLGCGEQVQA